MREQSVDKQGVDGNDDEGPSPGTSDGGENRYTFVLGIWVLEGDVL